MAAAPPESWTDQRVNQLKKLWTQGKSASEIADALGGVTRNAVIGKAHRLGLSGRPSPIKKAPAPVKKPAAPPTKPAAKPVQKAGAKPEAKAASDRTADKTPSKTVPAKPAGAAANPAGTAKGTTKPAAPAVAKAPAAPAAHKAPANAAKPNALPVKASPFNQPLTPEVMARPLMVHDGKVISILELSEKTCRWPIGDPKDPAFGYCGLTVHPNFPYCPGHVVMAFQSSRKDTRRVASPDVKVDAAGVPDIEIEDIEVAEDEEDIDADALDDDADEGDDLAV